MRGAKWALHTYLRKVFVKSWKRAFVFFNRCINGSPTKPRQELRKMLLALLATLSSDQDALATLYGAAGGAAWGWKNDGWLPSRAFVRQTR